MCTQYVTVMIGFKGVRIELALNGQYVELWIETY